MVSTRTKNMFLALFKYQKMLQHKKDIKNLSKQNTAISIHPSSSYAKRIDSFWKDHYGKGVNNFYYHAAIASVNGIEDERYIPKDIWLSEILPWLNRLSLHDAYTDKNSTDVFLKGFQAPVTILKKINGNFYLNKNQPTSYKAAYEHLMLHEETMFIKPSFTSGGENVKTLVIKANKIFIEDIPVSFERLDTDYGKDYIIQSKIEQHPIMQAIYPGSVNTLRMVTFRFKGKIHLLFTFARFGNRGRVVDNMGAGGLGCNVNKEGRLNTYAFDKFGYKFEKHPFTNYVFKDALIPNMNIFSDYVISLHEQLPYFDIVSWDIVVGTHAEPILLELNLVGESTIYQMINGPLFGPFTEELLETIRDSQYRPSLTVMWKS
jgi:hypothetical protein